MTFANVHLVTSRELTSEQLDRMRRVVERHRRYYLLAWQRAQANDMPLNDPLVEGICKAWDGLSFLADRVEALQRNVPQPYRPLAKSTKASGLRSVDLPWAERQRQMAAEAEAARRPSPPNPSR